MILKIYRSENMHEHNYQNNVNSTYIVLLLCMFMISYIHSQVLSSPLLESLLTTYISLHATVAAWFTAGVREITPGRAGEGVAEAGAGWSEWLGPQHSLSAAGTAQHLAVSSVWRGETKKSHSL